MYEKKIGIQKQQVTGTLHLMKFVLSTKKNINLTDFAFSFIEKFR